MKAVSVVVSGAAVCNQISDVNKRRVREHGPFPQ